MKHEVLTVDYSQVLRGPAVKKGVGGRRGRRRRNAIATRASYVVSMRPRLAPPGYIYVCGGCGAAERHRYDLGDASCILNAVLCYDARPWVAVPGKANRR